MQVNESLNVVLFPLPLRSANPHAVPFGTAAIVSALLNVQCGATE